MHEQLGTRWDQRERDPERQRRREGDPGRPHRDPPHERACPVACSSAARRSASARSRAARSSSRAVDERVDRLLLHARGRPRGGRTSPSGTAPSSVRPRGATARARTAPGAGTRRAPRRRAAGRRRLPSTRSSRAYAAITARRGSLSARRSSRLSSSSVLERRLEQLVVVRRGAPVPGAPRTRPRSRSRAAPATTTTGTVAKLRLVPVLHVVERIGGGRAAEDAGLEAVRVVREPPHCEHERARAGRRAPSPTSMRPRLRPTDRVDAAPAAAGRAETTHRTAPNAICTRSRLTSTSSSHSEGCARAVAADRCLAAGGHRPPRRGARSPSGAPPPRDRCRSCRYGPP